MKSFSLLDASEKPYAGTLVTLAAPEVSDALVLAGLQWLFLDLEHSPALDPRAVLRIVQTIRGRADVLVRVPDNDEIWIKKVLDAGADGIIIPHVKDAVAAQRAVAAAKYPPMGHRSVGITPAHRYGADFGGYISSANEKTYVIVQIEDAEAVDNVDSIIEVPGVSAAFVGPYDLSGSLGRLGDVGHPEVQQAIDKVIHSCRHAGVPLGIFAADAATAAAALQRGVDFVAIGTDLAFLMSAAREVLDQLRSS